MASLGSRLSDRLRALPAARALRHRDFRLLWFGTFISFLGGQAQGVAQGYLVYDLTGDKAKLAMVWFAMMLPVSIAGPVLGAFVDVLNKRWVMTGALLSNAIGAAFMAIATYGGWITYEHVLIVAACTGLAHTMEMPARQSIVREVVGERDLPYAVPVQAMAMNGARIIGPGIGGVMTDVTGPGLAFGLNAVTFFGLIAAVWMIRAALQISEGNRHASAALIAEGMRYTLRRPTLRALFLTETATSVLGIWYLSQFASIAEDQLGVDAFGLGLMGTFTGVGGLAGLIFLSQVGHKPIKPLLIRSAMISVALLHVLLAFVRDLWLAMPILALLGASTIIQFNTTNTMFQMSAPERLRGRVLSMHMWAIMGASPLGVIVFGLVAERISLQLALASSGIILGAVSILTYVKRGYLREPARLRNETD